MGQIDILNNYIEKCNKVIEEKNNERAFFFQEELIQKFSKKIDISVIDYYGGVSGYVEENLKKNCIKNVENIRDELIAYKENLEKEPLPTGPKTVFNFNQNQTMRDSMNMEVSVDNNITLSLDQTFMLINQIPDEILSTQEKEILEDKLSSVAVLQSKNDKEKLSSKIGAILKFIADKGFDVLIAVLPYLTSILKS